MAQRIPLPLTVSCFSKIQIGFTFLVPAYPGCPGKEAVKWLLLLLLLCCYLLFSGGGSVGGRACGTTCTRAAPANHRRDALRRRRLLGQDQLHRDRDPVRYEFSSAEKPRSGSVTISSSRTSNASCCTATCDLCTNQPTVYAAIHCPLFYFTKRFSSIT